MNRPAIKTPCVADRYHAAGERIAEVTFPCGAGCLISIRTLRDGTPVVEVYRADAAVRVLGPRFAEVSNRVAPEATEGRADA